MAMLLRRLKDRVVKSNPGALQCIGTSATLGEDVKNFKLMAVFGERLFGEKFECVSEDPERQDIVIGHKKHLKIAGKNVKLCLKIKQNKGFDIPVTLHFISTHSILKMAEANLIRGVCLK